MFMRIGAAIGLEWSSLLLNIPLHLWISSFDKTLLCVISFYMVSCLIMFHLVYAADECILFRFIPFFYFAEGTHYPVAFFVHYIGQQRNILKSWTTTSLTNWTFPAVARLQYYNTKTAVLLWWPHMSIKASQVTGNLTACSAACSTKHQSSTLLTPSVRETTDGGWLPTQRASNGERYSISWRLVSCTNACMCYIKSSPEDFLHQRCNGELYVHLLEISQTNYTDFQKNPITITDVAFKQELLFGLYVHYYDIACVFENTCSNVVVILVTDNRLPRKRKFKNSLWLSDAIWQHKYGTTLVQVIASCLTSPTITWTSVDKSSVNTCCIYLKVISQFPRCLEF